MALLAVGLMAAAPTHVSAQTRFGVKASLASDNIDFGIGLRAEKAIGSWFSDSSDFTSRLRGYADFDYFFPDCGNNCDYSFWELGAGAQYLFVANTKVQPYAGAGIVYANASYDGPLEFPGFPGIDSSSSDLGLNLIGGIDFDLGSAAAFAEARIELGAAELFVVSAGIKLGGG